MLAYPPNYVQTRHVKSCAMSFSWDVSIGFRAVSMTMFVSEITEYFYPPDRLLITCALRYATVERQLSVQVHLGIGSTIVATLLPVCNCRVEVPEYVDASRIIHSLIVPEALAAGCDITGRQRSS